MEELARGLGKPAKPQARTTTLIKRRFVTETS